MPDRDRRTCSAREEARPTHPPHRLLSEFGSSLRAEPCSLTLPKTEQSGRVRSPVLEQCSQTPPINGSGSGDTLVVLASQG